MRMCIEQLHIRARETNKHKHFWAGRYPGQIRPVLGTNGTLAGTNRDLSKPVFILGGFVRSFWLSARNSVRGPLIQIQDEMHHFAGLGGGKGHQNREQTFCEQTDVS